MKSSFIKVTQISDINTLVNLSSKASDVVEIHKGRWCIDASSVMGVMSIDMTTGVTIVYNEADTELASFIERFVV